MRLPDFEAWAIFACVIEHHSFTGAADVLSLSKATVSKAITRLETSLGVTLFHRTSRRLSLTDSGAALADHARRIVAEAEAAVDAAQHEATQPRGSIRLAAPMSFGLSALGPVLADFLAAHPGISVDLHLSDEKIDLIGNRIDVALRIGTLPDSSLRARRLRPVERHVVASPAYLERHGRPTHPHDLSTHRCLGYAYLDSADQWRFVSQSGEEVSIRPAGPMRANNADVMLPALLAGLGVAIMPDFVVTDELARGTLRTVLADWMPPAAALHLVTPPGTIRPRRVEAMITFLSERLNR